ncbi:hypothetical protein QOZ80_8AG0630090 [Eleusine coracana subsp. coracana]|nr:hypothetical protein QOZ80_8AG0630090 [Eleusine coracana subsp. coracana]
MAAVAPPPDNFDPPPSTPPTTAVTSTATSTSTPPNPATPGSAAPNPNPNLPPAPSPVASAPPMAAPPMLPAPVSFAASFRPLGAPPPPPQQQQQVPPYGAVPNPGYPMAQPMQQPGVPGVMPPGAMRPPPMYMPPPQPGAYMPQPGVAVPHPGMPRYPAPYPLVRPGFPPRPMPPPGVLPIQRPPMITGIRGIPPVVTPVVRPPALVAAPSDKPPTAVYVGKIAPTVDNDFLLSLLRLCGPVKSWKRAQDPSNGRPKGFGFCEFESAESILRATRLLNKLSIDGQELVININDATKEYLKKHVEEKKKAQEKARETERGDGDGSTAGAENELSKPVPDESNKETGDAGDKDSEENTKRFGIVTDEDSEADKDAAEKISSMIEEWLKTRPPPPPPVQPSADISAADTMKTDSVDKNDADTDKKVVNETVKSETSSPDRRKDKERDKDKRDKELERYERERERERFRRDREREREKDHKYREVERLYRDRLKEWEYREREKELQRHNEKEREKSKEHDRRREIMKQEDESDEEDTRKRRRRGSSTLEERKRRRQREKEEDLADKAREEEEIAEARRQAIELQRQADEAAAAAAAATAESVTLMEVDGDDEKEANAQAAMEVDNITNLANGSGAGHAIHKDNNGDETTMTPGQISDTKQNSSAPTKKLGFGLIGLGKRTSVPSVFAEEDDENNDDKRLRPLVPIDYSTEELQAVPDDSSSGPNIVAAAEFAKRISVSNPKEEKTETEKDRSRRSSDRSSQRDKDRNHDDGGRVNDERREKMHDREKEKPKSENKKILDAKQLIDMIPRTKEELFAYDINWAVYDKHELHERMRPWISKKIIEFIGEEESTLVDYIVSCTKDHVQAEKMLELLQSILDVEAEMFVLKMWRMLIFEIKKVEAGLSGKAKA